MEQKELEEELMDTLNLHSSVNVFNNKKTLSLEGGDEEKRIKYRKRSSSMSLMKIPKNFVPKLKPIQTIICPSPINLNQKAPIPPVPEIQSNTISTASFDSQNDLNLKPIRCIYSRKKKQKKSFKFLNIEEEVYALSDKEDTSKNIYKIYSESDTSKSEDEDEDNNITNYKKIDILNNINLMREKMTKIKRNSKYNNDNLFDDSNIDNHYLVKSLGQYKNLCHPKNIIKERKNHNMNLNRLRSMKIRTKSFNIKQRYVPTILGFLEKSSSANSLNSNDK
jgi:hypothetical protein